MERGREKTSITQIIQRHCAVTEMGIEHSGKKWSTWSDSAKRFWPRIVPCPAGWSLKSLRWKVKCSFQSDMDTNSQRDPTYANLYF